MRAKSIQKTWTVLGQGRVRDGWTCHREELPALRAMGIHRFKMETRSSGLDYRDTCLTRQQARE